MAGPDKITNARDVNCAIMFQLIIRTVLTWVYISKDGRIVK
jgi:hypothetical protein